MNTAIKEKPYVLVTGAGGFIGGHLVSKLLHLYGVNRIRAVDIKPLEQWKQIFESVDNVVADLQKIEECHRVCEGADYVYNLASDMGGIGFIETNKALCMLSVLINTNMLLASRDAGVSRYFFSSSTLLAPQVSLSMYHLPIIKPIPIETNAASIIQPIILKQKN